LLSFFLPIQPKRPKKPSDNSGEIHAFGELKAILLSLLRNGQIVIIKQKLREILGIWHDGNKVSAAVDSVFVLLSVMARLRI
jgi:hypothetical protein